MEMVIVEIVVTEKTSMKWHNLKNNRCPKCNRDFLKNLEVATFPFDQKMFKHKCGFNIS